jgi:hypothetical protein
MGMKIMLDVDGEMFDLWDFRTIQRGEAYNEIEERMDYLILINKNAIATNYNDLVLKFETLEQRESKLRLIKEKFDEAENVMIL